MVTAEIVGAYVAHHTVATTDLPTRVATFGRELSGLGQTPAVPIRRSVRPDEIVCLACG